MNQTGITNAILVGNVDPRTYILEFTSMKSLSTVVTYVIIAPRTKTNLKNTKF